MNRRFFVAAACLGVVLCPGVGHTRRIGGTPTKFVDQLLHYDHVFVGTIDSAAVVPWVGVGACGEGLSGASVTRLVVRPEEGLQGNGLRPHEVLWSDSRRTRIEAKPGRRVIAWGRRGCPLAWQLWGGAFSLADLDSADGDRLRHVWEEEAPPRSQTGRALLAELRDTLDASPMKRTAAYFGSFDGLALVRVQSSTIIGDDAIEFSCRWIDTVAGTARADTMRIRFRRQCSFGPDTDSLLVPWRGPAPPRFASIETCPNHFRIVNGMMPGLGIAYSELGSIIRRADLGYSIPEILPARSTRHSGDRK